MKCPDCVSVIDDEALACPHCTRDLYLFRPLLARLQALESALDEASGRIAALESKGPAASASNLETTTDEPTPWPAWALLLPALLMLLAAHGLIVVLLDLPTLWLRLASLAIPLPFGYLLVRGSTRSLWTNLLMAAGVAGVAVIGMSGVVALIDDTTVLPANAREWREFLYDAVSIMLSFGTDMIVGRLRLGQRHRAPIDKNLVMLRLASAVWGAARDPAKVQKQLDAMHTLADSLAATATALAAAATGLKGVAGG